jgi:hypothetical protein
MIHIYNSSVEDHTAHPNNFPIYRGTILGNPFTHNGKRKSLAKLSFPTRDEAIDAYKDYFEQMYEQNEAFKNAVDTIYEVYKKGEDVYLQCWCKPLRCHGEVIRDFLQKKLIKETRLASRK